MTKSTSINPQPFAELIKEKCGFSIDAVDSSNLSSAIQTRMSTMGIHDSDHFFDLLVQDYEELIQIVDSLTVNETYFFREPQHFRVLCKSIIPRILGKEKATPIKLISVGCSTGEEPYTLAIALVEEFGLEILTMVEIMGADIDSGAITKAKKGVYGKYSFRNTHPDILKKYFAPLEGKRYKIVDSIKNKVTFYQQNLLSENYPDSFCQSDVIFYRNVSIYFTPIAQKIVLENLANQLTDGGHLFLSSTETYSHNLGILSLTELEGAFLYHKGRKKPTNPDNHISSKSKSRPLSPIRIRRSVHDTTKIKTSKRKPARLGITKMALVKTNSKAKDVYEEALASAKKKKYDPALAHLEIYMKIDPDCINARLLKASVLLNLRRLKEARNYCLDILKQDDLNYETLLLLGIIARETGDDHEAMKRFKSAIFIRPSSWYAHFHMAQLYAAQDNYASADREYAVTIRLIKRYGIDSSELLLFSFSFTKEQTIEMCAYHRKTMIAKNS